MKKLKPCPICGSEARITGHRVSSGIVVFVECSHCHISSEHYLYPETLAYDIMIAEAVADWNKNNGSVAKKKKLLLD